MTVPLCAPGPDRGGYHPRRPTRPAALIGRTSEEVQAARQADRLAAVPRAELAVDRALMGLHRVDREVELRCDLDVRKGAREGAQDGPFAAGERIDESARGAAVDRRRA